MVSDQEIKGFKLVLTHITKNRFTNGNENGDGEYLTHKEVRTFARSFKAVLPFLYLPKGEEIQFLAAALAAPGLCHGDRSFLASRIIKLLEEVQKEKSLDTSNF